VFITAATTSARLCARQRISDDEPVLRSEPAVLQALSVNYSSGGDPFRYSSSLQKSFDVCADSMVIRGQLR